jgi:CRP/FNR family transcriptional regulator
VREGDVGEGLYVVKQGVVKLSRTQYDGREQTVAFLGYGDIFGERTLLLDEALTVSAEVVGGATVCLIPKREFTAILRDKPEVTLQLAKVLASRVESFAGVISNLGIVDARTRVVSYLLSLARAQGKAAPQGAEIALPATRAETGRLLGMTPETFSRRMGELESEGLIASKGRRSIILSPELLANESRL